MLKGESVSLGLAVMCCLSASWASSSMCSCISFDVDRYEVELDGDPVHYWFDGVSQNGRCAPVVTMLLSSRFVAVEKNLDGCMPGVSTWRRYVCISHP